jgi:hypothetical protein
MCGTVRERIPGAVKTVMTYNYNGTANGTATTVTTVSGKYKKQNDNNYTDSHRF